MKIRKPNGYWSLARCIQDASQYEELTDWRVKSKTSYITAWKNGWLDICGHHLKRKLIKKGILTKEHCHQKALECKTRKEFEQKYPSEANAVENNRWRKECYSHMEKLGNRYFRALYSFEHPDMSVYIGLTGNYDRRYREHMQKSEILIEKNKLGGQVFKKFNVFYPKDEAAIKEDELIEKYKANGWIILNKTKGGSLGGMIKFWTKEECLKDSQKYNNRSAWASNSRGACASAATNNWTEECTAHMGEPINGVKKKIQCIETNEIFDSLHAVALKFNIQVSNLCRALKGRSKFPKNLTFKYVNST